MIAEDTGQERGENYRRMLLELLAVIHRDGGHKTQEIGVKLAWEQALALSSERIAEQTPPPASGDIGKLIERLRKYGDDRKYNGLPVSDACHQAADTLARLEGRLRDIANHSRSEGMDGVVVEILQRMASDALKNTGEGK